MNGSRSLSPRSALPCIAAACLMTLSVPLSAQTASPAGPSRADWIATSTRALEALQARSDGFWTCSTNRETGMPRMMMGGRSPSYGTTTVEAAQAFLAANVDIFLPGNAAKPPAERITLKFVSARAMLGSAVVEFGEEYRGVAVDGAALIAMVEPSGRVVHVTSTIDPRVGGVTTPAKTFEQVDASLRAARKSEGVSIKAETNTLVILPGDPPRLAYRALYQVGERGEPWQYMLDAANGQVLSSIRLVLEDSFGPPAGASDLTLVPEDGPSSRPSAGDKLLATSRVHVDLARQDGEGGVRPDSDGSSAGGAAYSLSASVDGFVGGPDADGDGYCDRYEFRIGVDGDASGAAAAVYARLVCTTTGQRWRSAGVWAINGAALDPRRFRFDESDFPGSIAGISALDFTVELWSSSRAASTPRRASASKASAFAASAANSGKSLVFNPNPVNKLNDLSLTDMDDSDAAVPLAAYDEVSLARLAPPQPSNNQYQLVGDFVEMMDREAPPNSPPMSATQDFRYTRGNPAFEEVMCYYHITRNQEYIQSLGFTNVNNRRQVADAHGVSGAMSAHYSPAPVGAGYLAFGDGGVDMAEDADIIFHEYGHAVQDNSAPGRHLGTRDRGYGNESRAMGEGFSDYWAFSSTYSESVAHGYNPTYLYEWVYHYPRLVVTVNDYPDYMVGEEHEDGRIWSACLWEIFNVLGKDAADRIILSGHFLVPNSPSFEDGANAILSVDTQLYGGAHVALIRSIFSYRGILDQPPRGTLQLSAAAYGVNENGGTVAITVTRTGGSFGKASVSFATADGSALAGVDYLATSGALHWATRDISAKTFSVPILRDVIAEADETFTVSLALSPTSRISLGTPTAATVTIGPPGTVQFSSSSYSANENGGTVTITATRSGGSYGVARVNYATGSGSASAGADYAPQSGVLFWGDGDTADKSFNISILDDSVYEGAESFGVNLSGANGVDLGVPAVATVTITDDERSQRTVFVSGDPYPNSSRTNRKGGGNSTNGKKDGGRTPPGKNQRPGPDTTPTRPATGGGAEVERLPAGSTNSVWPFEEGQGNVVHDEGVEGRAGVVHDARWTTNTAFEWSRYALTFGGTNDWVDLGADACLLPVTGLTLSVWVNPGTNQESGAVVASCFRSGAGSNDTGYGIFFEDATGTLACAIGLKGATNEAVVRVSVTNDMWQHVAMSYDRVSGLLRAYLNGQPAGERAVGPCDLRPVAAGTLTVGRRLRGGVDEIRIYDHSLSAPAISALYRGFPLLPFGY